MGINILYHIFDKKNDIDSFDCEGVKIATYLNPVSYCKISNSENLLNQFDFIFIDGIILTFLLNKLSIKKVDRRTFDMTSIAPNLFEHSIINGKSIYFIGSKEQEINRFISVIKTNYPKLKISGYSDGYINWNNIDDVISEIMDTNPSYIVVGMGTPLQEKFMTEIKNKCKNWNGIVFACGGFIHQTQIKLNYYPKWINKFNLRMPYRLFKEGLYSRLKYYPMFLFKFLRDYKDLKA